MTKSGANHGQSTKDKMSVRIIKIKLKKFVKKVERKYKYNS